MYLQSEIKERDKSPHGGGQCNQMACAGVFFPVKYRFTFVPRAALVWSIMCFMS